MNDESIRYESRARRRWVGIILGLLSLQFALTGLGVSYALRGGKSAIVEEDYYAKALHWDDHAALLRASRELAWTADLSVGGAVTSSGRRALMVQLRDAAGRPVDGARTEVAYFHLARPLDLHQAELTSTGGGLYAGSVPLDRPGIWEYRLTVRRAGDDGQKEDVFIQTQRQELTP